MPTPSPRLLAAALCLGLLPLAGCDQTGDLTTGTASQLVENARVARQDGDFETAGRVLDAALAAYPDDPSVRTEYAVMLLEREDINLFDLDRVASFLIEAPAATTPAPAPDPRTAIVCPFTLDPTASTFSPTAFAGYDDIAADAATLDRVLELLAPVVPATVRQAPLCGSVETNAQGPAFNYDRASALADLRTSGLREAEVGAALASDALARTLRAYLTVTTGLSQQATWYRFDSGRKVGVCAADPLTLQSDARGAIQDFGGAALTLDLRASAVGSSPDAQALIADLAEAYAEIRDGIGRYCTP